MTRAGKALERLVEHLERALAADEKATIQAPARLVDKVTEEPREFDVVVTIKASHHSLVTAIECRDWERPLDVSHVEAYETKCSHCDIQSKVIVSPVGFTEQALKKGQFLGIRCLKLSEISELTWVQTSSIGIRWQKILTADWQIDPKDPNKKLIGNQKGNLELCFPVGLPFQQVYLDKLLAEAIRNDGVIDRSPGTTWKKEYYFSNHAVRLLHKPTRTIFDCNLSVRATFKMESAKERLRFFEYEEIEGNKIAKGATADIRAPGMTSAAKVVLLEQPDGSRRIVVINPGEIASAVMMVQEESDK